MGEFLHTSIPVLLSDCLLGLGDNVLAIIMGRIGSGFVTANSITMVIQRVSTIVIMGLAFSGCFQTGQVLGKGEVQAARRQGNTYLLIGLVFGALASVIIRLISGTVISLYKITPETREIAMELMDALCIVVVFRSVNSILSKGVLRGGGDTRFLLAGGRAAGRIGGAYPEAATVFYLSLSVFRPDPQGILVYPAATQREVDQACTGDG